MDIHLGKYGMWRRKAEITPDMSRLGGRISGR
jgi:hypothetical protein